VTETWFERNHRIMKSFADATYRRYIWQAVMAAAIKLPLADEIKIVVGYDPQKLLPHYPNTGRWGESGTDPLVDVMAFMKEFYRKDSPERSFMETYFPRMEAPKRHQIEGGYFDMQEDGTVSPYETIEFADPLTKRIASIPMPIVLDNVRLSYPHIKPKEWPHKIAVIAVDYSMTEARILAAMAEKNVRGLVIDIDSLGGEIYSERSDIFRMLKGEPSIKPKATKQNGRSADYLKHDPSKRNRRHK
jgi:hypothetical protein